MKKSKEEQIKNLKSRVKDLETRIEEKSKRSNYMYEHGGDGWHDNASWEGLYQEIRLLNSMLASAKEALQKLKSKKPETLSTKS